MTLKEISKIVACKALGEPGTIVECMVDSKESGAEYGFVGRLYKVACKSYDNGLILEETGFSAIANRFRQTLNQESG